MPDAQSNSLLSVEDAKVILDPHLQKLQECITGGWDAWHRDYGHRHHVLCSRTRASIVYDEIRHLAEKKFTDCEGTRVIPKRGFFLLYIGDEIVLRFKKLDKRGLTRNLPTRQQRLFEAQRSIKGILPGTYLNAGYQLDDLQQLIHRTMVSCQHQRSIQWTIELSEIGEACGGVNSMPDPGLLSGGDESRVRPRIEKKKIHEDPQK